MKTLSTILLVALFLLPTRLVVAQGGVKPEVTPVPSPVPSALPSPSPAAESVSDPASLIKKTSKSSPIKVVNRPAPPEEFDLKSIQFLPPSKNFVPSKRTSIMTTIVCSRKDFLRVSTEGIVPFSMSVIKLSETGEILILQEDGSYLPYGPTLDLKPSRLEDVKLAQNIVKTIKPKKLTIMPNLVAMEKPSLDRDDPYLLVEILRDHMGREVFDVNVSQPYDCYALPKPSLTPTPVPTPALVQIREGIS